MRDKFQYTLQQADEGRPLKELIRREFRFSSRLLRKLKMQGGVSLNGEEIRLYLTGKAGDLLTISLPQEHSDFEPEDIPIQAAFEDDDLLVINKQPGFVVHPTKGQPSHTMANGLMNYLSQRQESYKIRFVNRLDRDTSGLLIVAKNSHCQDHLTKQMAENRVTKRYTAVVHGEFDEEQGTVDLPIGRPFEDHVIRAVMEDGYPSVTHYRVTERFCGFTMLELHLETGRTHQIRVHMSHIGHPLVSDVFYGREEPELISRQALHAGFLSFQHPVLGKQTEICAPLPEDMEQLCAKLRKRR